MEELGVGVDEKKDDEVPEETLKQYVGKYQLAPGFIITVTVDGKQIFAQVTGQQRFEIYPESRAKFYYKVVNAQIEFVNEGGKISKLILYQNGREMPAPKIE